MAKVANPSVGDRFGKWTIIAEAPCRTGKADKYWICQCDCGVVRNVNHYKLKHGRSKSCGCLVKEVNRTHGRAGTKTYKIWKSMKERCYYKNCSSYALYGDRGISVCKRWLKFENFLSDMGECPDGMSLDRIDVNGDYRPENCRWATVREQARNRRSNYLVDVDGQQICLMEAAEKIGVSIHTIRWRLRNGWPIHKALSTLNYRLAQNRTYSEAA